ncbi:MAG: UDP-4-amino-4,6-dideoxy-N-acetyl-beta-L-altrosamine transaminase [Alphaproteobacteria bacterium]
MIPSSKPSFLPYGRQCLDDEDFAAVTEALRADYLTTGPLIGIFEQAFAAAVGAKYAVVSNSGTAALHLATAAAGIGEGSKDGVIVPTVTFLATANVVRHVGGEVIFADVDPHNGLITAECLMAAIQRAKQMGLAPKAIMPVHLNGPSVDMIDIKVIAEKENLKIIEDACHAIGSEQAIGNGVTARVGACMLSDFACFSLHPVKTITMGEGGVTTTKDAQAAAKMMMMRSHGMNRDPLLMQNLSMANNAAGIFNPWYYEMLEPGFNYRATDFACALGLSQLRKLEIFARRRQELATLYDTLLHPLAPTIKPVPRPPSQATVLHLYAIQIDFAALNLDRGDAMRWLREKGIGTMVHYIPVHRQPYYVRRYGNLSLPGADAYYQRQLSIPFYPTMTEEDVRRVVETLTDLVRGNA